jgi:hypothetical protein
MHNRREWQEERARWAATDPEGWSKLEETLRGTRESHDQVISAMAKLG